MIQKFPSMEILGMCVDIVQIPDIIQCIEDWKN